MPDLEPGRSAIVMGLGRFGGGVGVATFLLKQGMDVIVTDLSQPQELEDSIAQLNALDVTGTLDLQLGSHEGVPFEDVDLVVASPAVPRPWSNPYLRAACEAGIPVCTEIQLLLDRIDQRKLIAVTGSSGKSSTCAMIHHVLADSGFNCLLGGNLGGSLLGHSRADLEKVDVVVLELSSFMLHWIGNSPTPFQPATSVLTTLSSNHIDWHESAEHYVRSKRILLESAANGRLILPLEPSAIDTEMGAWLDTNESIKSHADGTWESELDQRSLLNAIELTVPGPHQRDNAATALRAIACHFKRAPRERLDEALKLAPKLGSFTGLPHRLKPLPGFNGIQVIDDSKSTTPEASMKAVEAFESPRSIHLIAGGFDKKSDLSIIDGLGDHLAGLYAIGATGNQLMSGKNAVHCETIEEAVRRASGQIRTGEILLLSPGCASWDQFENYEARGRAFEKAARKLLPDSYLSGD